MARFNRMRYDYRGPEYDRRYGRFEAAFARRFALERWERETPTRRRYLPGRWRFRVPPGNREFFEDQQYSRRYWPPSRAHWYRSY